MREVSAISFDTCSSNVAVRVAKESRSANKALCFLGDITTHDCSAEANRAIISRCLSFIFIGFKGTKQSHSSGTHLAGIIYCIYPQYPVPHLRPSLPYLLIGALL